MNPTHSFGGLSQDSKVNNKKNIRGEKYHQISSIYVKIQREKPDNISEIICKKQKMYQSKEYTCYNNARSQSQFFPTERTNQRQLLYQSIFKKQFEEKLLNLKRIIEDVYKWLADNKGQQKNFLEKAILRSQIQRKKELIKIVQKQQQRIINNVHMTQEDRSQIFRQIQNEQMLKIDEAQKDNKNKIKRYYERKINAIYEKYVNDYEEKFFKFNQHEYNFLQSNQKKIKILYWIKEEENERKEIIYQQIKKKRQLLIDLKYQLKNSLFQKTKPLLQYQIKDVQEEIALLKDKREMIGVGAQSQLQISGPTNIENDLLQAQKQSELFETAKKQQLKIQIKRISSDRSELINKLNRCYDQKFNFTGINSIYTEYFGSASQLLVHQLKKMEHLLNQMKAIQKKKYSLSRQLQVYNQTKRNLNSLIQNQTLRLNSQYLETNRNEIRYTVNIFRGNKMVEQERPITKVGNLEFPPVSEADANQIKKRSKSTYSISYHNSLPNFPCRDKLKKKPEFR